MAVRIAGVNIPEGKHTRIGLRHILGIGPTRAEVICGKAGVDPAVKIKDLTESEVAEIRKTIDALYKGDIEGELQRRVLMDIKRKTDLGCYQGIRHRRGLPLRGQNTQKNARTRKGKRKPVRG